MAAPTVPLNFLIDQTASNLIQLDWDQPVSADEDGYYLYKSIDGITYYKHAVIPTGTTIYWDYNVGYLTQYWYKVSAYNVDGEGPEAGPLNPTTLARNEEKAWMGSSYKTYDTNAIYAGETIGMVGFRSEGTIRCDAAAVEDEDLVRKVEAESLFAVRTPSFVVVSLSASLDNERALTAGTNITLIDAGVGSTLTIDVDAHASDHEIGGADLIDHDNLTNFLAAEHIDWTGASDNFNTSGSVVTGALLPGGKVQFKAGAFTNGDTTPNVSSGNMFQTQNTAPTAITTFDNGVTGQLIFILFGDGNTTLTDGATLQLQGGANWTPNTGDTIMLARGAGVWYEFSRSAN